MPMVDAKIENPTWKDKTALFVSVLFSPFLIIPVFILLITSRFSRTTHEFLLYTFIALFFSTIVPFINVFIAVRWGKITDIHVANRKERKEPFIVSLLGILAGTLILYQAHAPREIVILGWVMLLNGFLFFVITLFWKISMHSSILASVLISLAILLGSWFVAGFIILPPLIWARIRRHRHNVYQGIIATVLAALMTYLLFRAFGMNF